MKNTQNTLFDMSNRYSPGHISPYNFLFHWRKIKPVISAVRCNDDVPIDILPITIEINPTDKCNHNCTWCFTKSTRTDHQVSFDSLLNTLNSINNIDIQSIHFSGGGEPSLHSALQYDLKHIKNIKTTKGIISNGTIFSENSVESIHEHFDWIRLSIDAGSSDIHAKYHRNGTRSYDSISSNIKKLCSIKNRKTIVGASYIMPNGNQSTINDLLLFCKIFSAYGIDFLQIKPELSATDSLHTFGQIQNALKGSDCFAIINQPLNTQVTASKCWYSLFSTVISADNNIYSCCFNTYNPGHSISRIKTSFDDSWINRTRLDRSMAINPNGCKLCRHCDFNNKVEQIITSSASFTDISNAIENLDLDLARAIAKNDINVAWLIDAIHYLTTIKSNNCFLQYPVYRNAITIFDPYFSGG